MKTFREYVTTPGRPAEASPASRTAPPRRDSSSSASPRALSRIADSVTSRVRPSAARRRARRTALALAPTPPRTSEARAAGPDRCARLPVPSSTRRQLTPVGLPGAALANAGLTACMLVRRRLRRVGPAARGTRWWCLRPARPRRRVAWDPAVGTDRPAGASRRRRVAGASPACRRGRSGRGARRRAVPTGRAWAPVHRLARIRLAVASVGQPSDSTGPGLAGEQTRRTSRAQHECRPATQQPEPHQPARADPPASPATEGRSSANAPRKVMAPKNALTPYSTHGDEQ